MLSFRSWLTLQFRILFLQNAAYLTMGPKKGRRVRKIEVPTDSVPEFEQGDTASDIERRREAKEREEAQKQRV